MSSSFVATPARERHLALLGQATGDGRDLGAHLGGEKRLDAPLQMGGIWIPPIKLLDGIWFGINGQWIEPATSFTSGFGYVQMALPTNSTQYKLGTPDIRLYLLWIYSPGEGDHWLTKGNFHRLVSMSEQKHLLFLEANML